MKRELTPKTRKAHPEPPRDSEDWVVWAAWADRITFEEIERRTGLREKDVIRVMRKRLKPARFRRWRARASHQSLKHEKLFAMKRRGLRGVRRSEDES